MPQSYEILTFAIGEGDEMVEVKFCSGVTHPDYGAFVVVDGWGKRGTGKFPDKLKGQCRACEVEMNRRAVIARRTVRGHSARRAETHVQASHIWWVFEELRVRIGVLILCEAVGISPNAYYQWKKGRHRRMKKTTAAAAMRLLLVVREIQGVPKEEAYRLRDKLREERRKKTLGLVQGSDGRWYQETNMKGHRGQPTLMVEGSLALAMHQAASPIAWSETPHRLSSVVDIRDMRSTEEMLSERRAEVTANRAGTNGRAEVTAESLTRLDVVVGGEGRSGRLRDLLAYQRRMAQAREDLDRARAAHADTDH